MDPEIHGILILCGYAIPFVVVFILIFVWAMCRSAAIGDQMMDKADRDD